MKRLLYLLIPLAFAALWWLARPAALEVELVNPTTQATERLTLRLPSGEILRLAPLEGGERRSIRLHPARSGGLLVRWTFVGDEATHEDYSHFLERGQSGKLEIRLGP